MAAHLLNVSSTLQCPHGGSVMISSANSKVKADGAFAALSTDTFTITGCSNTTKSSPPVPDPCLTVKWIVTNMRTKTNGTPNLNKSSSGLCLNAAQVPAGNVTIANTQSKASGL